MSPFNGPNATWWKIVISLLPLVVAAVFAFATLREDVTGLSAQVTTKADAAVVQANQDAILRELNIIEDQLKQLQGGRSR